MEPNTANRSKTPLNTVNRIITDMAVERIPRKHAGITVREDTVNGFQIHRLSVNVTDEALPERGQYITVTVGKPWLESGERISEATQTIANLITELSAAVLGEKKPRSALMICLGNRKITADAIGPLCADTVVATRHLERERPEIWRNLGEFSLSVLATGVSGSTGLEAFELTQAAVKTAKPQLVITLDALSARDTARLGTTVQLTDTGITPGSGIGNSRMTINGDTLGIPVISIGVPTVAHSATLISDALEKSRLNATEENIEKALSVGGDLFVTLRDCDVAVSSMARIISSAVNLAFLGFEQL